MWTCARQCPPLCKVVPTTSYVGAAVGWALHLQGALLLLLLPPNPCPSLSQSASAQAKLTFLWCLANRACSLCVDCKMPCLHLHLQPGVLCSLRNRVAGVFSGKNVLSCPHLHSQQPLYLHTARNSYRACTAYIALAMLSQMSLVEHWSETKADMMKSPFCRSSFCHCNI